MPKVIYTARHRLRLPGRSGMVYEMRKGDQVTCEDGELDAHPSSFIKSAVRQKRNKKGEGKSGV